MRLTNNFTSEEFDCRDGTKIPDILFPNVVELARNLQCLRDHLGEPVHIISGYRHNEYNRKVGGVTGSQHLQAKAADISVKSLTPIQLGVVIEALIKAGEITQGGLGIYPGFVHYDIRGTRFRW